jgi:hypothetical protein
MIATPKIYFKAKKSKETNSFKNYEHVFENILIKTRMHTHKKQSKRMLNN